MSENSPAAVRRARPSGREARQKARAARPTAPAYISRELPPYEFLSPDALEAIERHADLLLEEIGLEIRG
ncbi:MAG TPA: trimethylamine methyltransferase family protein, partial [Steroidobacteraceae bacterium]|nr:trimethylamine methyltransferase family protein [Steroidobacteraceae bacterium]